MALRYLGQRDYAGRELERKLTQRGATPTQAEAVVQRMVDTGLLSDARFAEVFTRYRVERGFGPSRIRSELRQRGVSDRLSSEALSSYAEQWHERASDFIQRKHRGTLDRKAKARLYRSGLTRGYTHDQVMRAIEGLSSD